MNTCILKRLASELKTDLTPNYDKISVIYGTNSTSVAINNVTFVLSNSYPFSSPSIFIDTFSNALGSAATYPPNNISYYQYMISSSPRINRITTKLNNNTCMCCTTISCKNNWMPSHNLKKLMTQIEKMKLIKHKGVKSKSTQFVLMSFNLYLD